MFQTPAWWVGAGLALGLVASAPSVDAVAAPHSYAIATESPTATREAERALTSGANAFDAVVLAALVAGFANPVSSGPGGGGFALVWSARDHRAYAFDFREMAPAGVDADVLNQRPISDTKRGQTVGVPGEIAGLFELEQRFGKLGWKDLASRAARVADAGFSLDRHMFEELGAGLPSTLTGSAQFRSVYLPGGARPLLGQRLRAPKMAGFLRKLASDGRRGFYEGAIAAEIVQTANAAGAHMASSDLASYRVIEREPLRVQWEGKQILTMPPPSAGGLLLAETLSLFSRTELKSLDAEPAKRLHLLAEAMRGAAADRARYVGDPAFAQVDTTQLLAAPRMQARKAHLAADRTHTQPRFGLEDAGTHHIAVADHDGNWVSLTTTTNDAFGAKLLTSPTGIFLNNQLTDFTPPDAVAAFGITASPNQVRPGARPVSSMTPTLVLENGEPMMALGGSGALTIAPNTTQVLLQQLAFGLRPEQAVAAPRFTIPSPSTGQTLLLESALAKLYGAELTARGELWSIKDSAHAVQVVTREHGVFSAAADLRKHGSAAVNNAPDEATTSAATAATPQ
jgi:gamma-glutamyltranspeptidase/glutathione hydrolase